MNPPRPRRHARHFLCCATLLAALSAAPGRASCPVEGDATSSPAKTLNRLKNRTSFPTASQIDSSITLARIAAPGHDAQRFSSSRAATVVGFVDSVYVGGIESANCHATDPLNRDTHIEITPALEEDRSKRVIVEVTPRLRQLMKAHGADWRTSALEARLFHHQVRFTGWMMFDTDHATESRNTHQGTAEVWRATAWELHPVTAIQVLSATSPTAHPR